MNVRQLLGIFLAATVVTVQAVEPTPLAPKDFAYGMPLQTDSAHSVFSLAIPAQVYRTVTRPDLGDVRVFNHDGEPVPSAIQPYGPGRAEVSARTKLPLSPIFAQAGRAPNEIRLYVHRSASGASVRVYGHGGTVSADKKPAFYVVACGGLKRPIQALDLVWKPKGHSFIRGVHVDAAEDLRHWHSVSDYGSIAEMVYGKQTVMHGRIKLEAVKAKYLRIRFIDGGSGPRLTGVYAEELPDRVPPPVERADLEPRRGPKAGEFLFDAGGLFPLDRAHLEFPQQNDLMRVSLFACGTSDGPCHPLAAGLVWQLHQGKRVLHRQELKFARETVRWLLLRVDQSEGDTTVQAPKLRVGWVPDRIVFIARGPAPYVLAYGSRAIEPSTYPVDSLVSEYSGQAKVTPFPATAGPAHALGGPRLLTPKRELPWKQWILWAVLVLSVVLLAWMALRLAKQMR